jgi:predicted nuclease of predicted toxin-antitoxin system
MKPLQYPLLADENINREVVATLAKRGKDIRSVADESLTGADDTLIIERAFANRRVVLTHDSDFGKLAISIRKPCIGIIYLRPGHISPSFVIEMLDALDALEIETVPPFIVVVDRKADTVRIRLRNEI